MELKDRIKDCIKKSSDYATVAEKTGIGRSTLERWAAGKNEPKLSDLMKIADATNSDAIHLAFGDLVEKTNENEVLVLSAMKRMGEDELRTAMDVIKALVIKSNVRKEL
ncbi:helix-turn-helix domain-containing protein [Motilimonas pumila]|uniref:XRE family transcriptional regulator n=1 Tax=Motilimonas pumila TaxID=2303987 RepID=A0A418Y9D2_9GAMM|nr:helix-turn-helix transcriptional regulator [Motilimonas pumila]RJG36966.1 XRE family transcriptional regulator [Motilimonas pumila]